MKKASVFVCILSFVLLPLNSHGEPAVALLPGNALIGFDTAAPGTITSSSNVTGLGANETLRGIDVRPATGELFGYSVITGSSNNSTMRVYKINPATGAAVLVGQGATLPGAADVDTAFDFNPVVDRMRIQNVNDENGRMNPNNGALSGDDTNITPAATTALIASAYDRNTAGNPRTTLYTIDRINSSFGVQGGVDGTAPGGANGGTVASEAPLGFVLDASRDGGFDISAGGTAYAALSNIGTGVTGLYTINLTFGGGAATLIGQIGDGTMEIYGLTILLADSDGDGVFNSKDNCANAANADQADQDADGIGDSCDPDKDGDGLSDVSEGIIGSSSTSSDSDGDGLIDGSDACPGQASANPNGCPAVSGEKPETQITSAPANSKKKRAAIAFSSSIPGAAFECALDKGGFSSCASPKRYNRLKKGRHIFKVRALSPQGILDLTPAEANWRISK